MSPQGLPSGNEYIFEDDPYTIWLYGIVAFIVFTGSICALKKLYSKIKGRNVKGDPNYRLRRAEGENNQGYQSFKNDEESKSNAVNDSYPDPYSTAMDKGGQFPLLPVDAEEKAKKRQPTQRGGKIISSVIEDD